MVVSLTRIFQSFGQESDDLPTQAAKNAQELGASQEIELEAANIDSVGTNNADDGSVDGGEQTNHKSSPLTPPERANRICDALAQVSDIRTPTPLTDRYLSNRAQMRPTNRPPFDPDTLWYLKHGRCPIMTELIDVVVVA